MDDVKLTALIQALTDNSTNTKDQVDKLVILNNDLLKKLDNFSDNISKAGTGLESKIDKMTDSAAKSSSKYSILEQKLTTVADLIKDTNKISSDQTKILENLDIGGRRLKGDTYDASTTREKQLVKMMNKIGGGGSGLVGGAAKVVGGLGAYKLLGLLWQNRLLLGGLGAMGLMNPKVLSELLTKGLGDMDISQALGKMFFGQGSFLRNRVTPGGFGDQMLEFTENNLGYAALGTVGTALGLGTKTGRSLVRGAAKLPFKLPGLAYRGGRGGLGMMSRGIGGARALYGGGVAGMNYLSANTLGRMAYTPYVFDRPGGMTPSGSRAAYYKPDTIRQIFRDWRNSPSGRRLSGTARNSALTTFRRTGSKTAAQRIATLIAARGLQAAAVTGSTGGVGAVVGAGLLVYGVYEIADILYDSFSDDFADWWAGNNIEKEAASLEGAKTAGFAAEAVRQASIGTSDEFKLTDDLGNFLTPEKLRAQKFKQRETRKWNERQGDYIRNKIPLTEGQKKKNKALEELATALENPFFPTARGDIEKKNRAINRILGVSDGTEFIGRKWTKEELWNLIPDAPTADELFRKVILPRATTGSKLDYYRTNYVPTGETFRFEGGMPIKGSKAEFTAAERTKMFATDLGMTEEQFKAGVKEDDIKNLTLARLGIPAGIEKVSNSVQDRQEAFFIKTFDEQTRELTKALREAQQQPSSGGVEDNSASPSEGIEQNGRVPSSQRNPGFR